MNLIKCCVIITSCAPMMLWAQNLSLPFEEFEINSDSCQTISSRSGSLISVSDNTFSCPTNVKLRYREISKPSEMVASGITMKFENTYMESSGMFEMRADCNGESIEINDGKDIKVNLVPTKALDNVAQFYFEEGSPGKWVKIDSDVSTLAADASIDKWGSSDISGDESVIGMEDFEGDFWCCDDPESKRKDSLRRLAFQEMSIDQMGFYNCDRLIEEETVKLMVAITKKGKATKDLLYVVYDDLNSVLTFYPYDDEYEVTLIKGKQPRTFLISDEGEIALSTEEFNSGIKAIDYGQSDKPGSAKELATITGIK